MKLVVAVAGVALLGLVAACGGSDPIDVGLPDGAMRVDQRSLRFQPNELTVDALETVYFTNSETALHTVTINGENESGEMERGDVFSFTFPGAGEYDITCDYHPQMRATITVR